jgi:hypothetical protein
MYPNSKYSHPPFYVSALSLGPSIITPGNELLVGGTGENTVLILQRQLDYAASNGKMRDEW